MKKNEMTVKAPESPQVGAEPVAVSQTGPEKSEQAQEGIALPAESAQEGTLSQQVIDAIPSPPDPIQAEALPQRLPEDAAAGSGLEPEAQEDEPDPVCYRVSCPGGVHLRAGPGKAYRSLEVLPVGALVLTDDAMEMLRVDRSPGDSAWMMVLSPAGSGWVDGAYLERVDERAE